MFFDFRDTLQLFKFVNWRIRFLMSRTGYTCNLFRLRADAPITDDELEKIAMELGIHNNLHDEGPDIKTQCKFCEKSFRNKRYMMEHYVRHHRAANQKLPHRCEVCGKGILF